MVNGWKKRKSINEYVPYSWINTKKGLLLEIHYDIGFGKKRNVTIYNYRNSLRYEVIENYYVENEKEALKIAHNYMRKN
jgi:hypothetical protein